MKNPNNNNKGKINRQNLVQKASCIEFTLLEIKTTLSKCFSQIENIIFFQFLSRTVPNVYYFT